MGGRTDGGSANDKSLAALVVPRSPQGSRPLLAQVVVSRGEVLGAHVHVPVRREDDNALMDAGAIHARLRLGGASRGATADA